MTEPEEQLDTNELMTAHEAAELLGVSQRSIYTYIETGDLHAGRIGTFFILRRSEVLAYQPRGAGRKRAAEPIWRKPSSPALLLTITVPILPGKQWQDIDPRIEEIRQGKLPFPGMVFRCLAHNQNEGLEMALIWKPTAFLHCIEERQAVLAALFARMKECLNLFDWDALTYKESPVDMLASTSI